MHAEVVLKQNSASSVLPHSHTAKYYMLDLF